MIALVIAGAVAVEGDSTCPTATRVAEALAPLLGDTEVRDGPHRARLEERAGGVAVELWTGPGRPLGQRTFPLGASCDELASAIAVVIATWEAELAAGAPRIDVSDRRAVEVAPTSSTTLSVGAGALVAVDGAGWATGGLAELAIGRTRSRWSAGIAAMLATRRRDELAPGTVAWAREGLRLGARYRVAHTGLLAVEATADVVLGLLIASGDGFTVERTAYSFEPGAALGARLAIRPESLGGFIAATATGWVRDGELEVTGIAETIPLPRYELHVLAGLTWRVD